MEVRKMKEALTVDEVALRLNVERRFAFIQGRKLEDTLYGE
jgi:hypothetical protein